MSSVSTTKTLYDHHGEPCGLVTTPGLPPEVVIADLDFRMRTNNEWVATQRYLGNISDEDYRQWLMADYVYYPPLMPKHNEQ